MRAGSPLTTVRERIQQTLGSTGPQCSWETDVWGPRDRKCIVYWLNEQSRVSGYTTGDRNSGDLEDFGENIETGKTIRWPK